MQTSRKFVSIYASCSCIEEVAAAVDVAAVDVAAAVAAATGCKCSPADATVSGTAFTLL